MKYIFSFLVVIVVFGITNDASAAGGLVTCEGTLRAGSQCDFCTFMAMVENIAQWLVGILIILSVIMLAITGLQLAMSGGDENAKTLLKSRLINIVIGFVLIIASWTLVDTLMKAIVSDASLRDSWRTPMSELCGAQLIPISDRLTGEQSEGDGGVVADPSATATADQCADDTYLLSRFSGSPVGVNAPGLDAMLSCYKSDPDVAALLSGQSIYTYDQSHPRCSLTNGSTACGACSHSVGSCHYGGGTGQGAMAGDFNAADGSEYGEAQLYGALKSVQSKCGGKILFENDHTHISLSACPAR